MKEFFKVLRRFVPPYKKYLVMSLVFTFLSAILNVFSFMVIIPILQILFKVTDTSGVVFIPWSEATSENMREVAINNATYYLNSFSDEYGASLV
ncbi:MAG: ABC transporter ATP-binding protein, partial [Bacteroidaceae bacterium]|nr:ABC transporter ATP-binding protein [Bacteroidaceae bacterium]